MNLPRLVLGPIIRWIFFRWYGRPADPIDLSRTHYTGPAASVIVFKRK